jgi:hypothetical protein
VKSICYFVIITRSNIIKIAFELTQHFINFNSKHLKAADHCIKYLHVIKFLIIRYSNSENEELSNQISSSNKEMSSTSNSKLNRKTSSNKENNDKQIFKRTVDAFFANDLDRKSAEKYIFKLFDDMIDWIVKKQFIVRVAVGLGWTRARASNPKVGQDWAHSFCSRGLDGFGFLFERIDRIRILVRRIESNRHTCSSGTQSESRLIQKSRVEWSILRLNDQVCFTNWAEQAILSEPELWVSSGVLILRLGFGFCSSSWIGLKKSVRTQHDGHTIHRLDFHHRSETSFDVTRWQKTHLMNTSFSEVEVWLESKNNDLQQ